VVERVIQELDSIALDRDLPTHCLRKGDLGTVVFCYPAGEAYEVEFLRGDGATIAVVTLPAGDLRPLGPRDIFHVRSATTG